MLVKIYKDPSAIRFIRCVSPVPGTDICAGGAGFTIEGAAAKCESELIERDYELNVLRPSGIAPIGIAAHLTEKAAHEKAKHEAIETLCVRQIHSEKEFRCFFKVKAFGVSLAIARTSHGYFSMIRGDVGGIKVIAYSAARSILSTILKAWEEYRSMHFFKLSRAQLKTFTKANFLFSEEEIGSLKFAREENYIYRPNLTGLTAASAAISDRQIVYLYKKEETTQ